MSLLKKKTKNNFTHPLLLYPYKFIKLHNKTCKNTVYSCGKSQYAPPRIAETVLLYK